MLLKDKVAVITGAASGIGKSTAMLFAREGAKVICIDIDDKLGVETVNLIREQQLVASYHHADVSKSAEIEAVAHECENSVSKVDILFNNAGSIFKHTFEATSEETWSQMIGVIDIPLQPCSFPINLSVADSLLIVR